MNKSAPDIADRRHRLHMVWLVLRESVKSFGFNRGLERAAARSYYGFFAMIPLTLIVVGAVLVGPTLAATRLACVIPGRGVVGDVLAGPAPLRCVVGGATAPGRGRPSAPRLHARLDAGLGKVRRWAAPLVLAPLGRGCASAVRRGAVGGRPR